MLLFSLYVDVVTRLLTKYYYSIVLPLAHKVFDILLCPVDAAYKAVDKIIQVCWHTFNLSCTGTLLIICSSGANFSSIVQVTEENLAALFINCGQVQIYGTVVNPFICI